MRIVSHIEDKLNIEFDIEEIVGIDTVGKLIEMTKNKMKQMSFIFINSINNFKNNKNKIFFRDFEKSINGKDCLIFIDRIISFLKKK